jgi:hypothetical protein
MMKQLVIGLGEVGGPLRDVLGADGYDLRDPRKVGSRYDVLHIAYPYGPDFVKSVRGYAEAFEPDLVVIHSTVPIGTTRQLGPDAVHSPVNGRHGFMHKDLVNVLKWVGGPRAQDAGDLFLDAGIRAIVYDRAEQTEAMKLLCLTQYGLDNAFARYREYVGKTVGLTHDDFALWTDVYNLNLDDDLHRPLIKPDGPKIGGHCVIPGASMLHRDHPSVLTISVLEHK